MQHLKLIRHPHKLPVQLQLDVMRNEAAVTEQLNNMRSIELSLEQNRLSRKVKRERAVYIKGSLFDIALIDSEDLLQCSEKRREITLEGQKIDADMQQQQLNFLKATGDRLEKSLIFARDNMNSLLRLNIRYNLSEVVSKGSL